jgi:hypothetical protein
MEPRREGKTVSPETLRRGLRGFTGKSNKQEPIKLQRTLEWRTPMMEKLRAATSMIIVSMFFLISCPTMGDIEETDIKTRKFPYAPIISEISPVSTVQEPAWIELYNPLNEEVKTDGLAIVINDDFRYEFPKKMPSVQPHGFVVLKLDGKGEAANEYEGKMSILHSEAKVRDSIKTGQVAVYKNKKLVGFVSWNAPGSKKSLTPERHKIWKKGWFVPTYPSFGLYLPESRLPKQFIIGLPPGSQGLNPEDWAVYATSEGTPGKINVLPSVMEFTLTDGAVIRSEDIAVGWTGTKHAKQYEFQLSKNADFSQIVEQKILSSNVFKPKTTLAEGEYYYRVRIIDQEGRKSSWSRTMKVISKKMVSQPASRSIGAVQENELTTMVFKYQRKDTGLLCLDGCDSDLDAASVEHWDKEHPTPPIREHGNMNCVRASTAMMVSFYGAGKILSQDRIAYFDEEAYDAVGNGIPEGDLAHSHGVFLNPDETEVIIEWALDEQVTVLGDTDPTFAEVQGWIDSNQPLMTVFINFLTAHMRVLNGYRVDDANEEWVHIMDPWSGPRWETYDTWTDGNWGVWVGPVSAPDAREDEATVAQDSDGDGVMDFDEQERFATGWLDADSDNDAVHDKEDIYEYVFNAADNYSKRIADTDADGERKEKDPDNEADTFNDGCEDKNYNGKYEPALGETNNYSANVNLACIEKPVHTIIVFDRSGSMVYPWSDPVKKYDEAASAATLFLDTWLANNPPAQTKVGLVFYDNNAYFDTGATTNTTLDVFDQAKRDKIDASFDSNRPNGGSTSIGGGLLKAMDTQGFDIDNVSTDDQNRVVIVLTDGMENANPRMDDPNVTQKLSSGKVDGYVLGIGDETQINMGELNKLANILNHIPAYFAKDLENFEIEKFFLQVLAETQGLEFTVDPSYKIPQGKSITREVAVNPGTELVTFVVVWKTLGVSVDFTLKNPQGNPVNADSVKTNDFYKLATKISPSPGPWTLTFNAFTQSGEAAESDVSYNLMVLEKNSNISSSFKIKGVKHLTGQPIRLTATLSEKMLPMTGKNISVDVTKPVKGKGNIISDYRTKAIAKPKAPEANVTRTPLDIKHQVMATKGIRIPTAKTKVALNDKGVKGDEVPGDGIYTGYFNDTKVAGVYTFRFMAIDGQTGMSMIFREKSLTVLVKPAIRLKDSKRKVLKRTFDRAKGITKIILNIIPLDRYGNKVGPGMTDDIVIDLKRGKVISVKDKYDGSYDVEMEIKSAQEIKMPVLEKMRIRSLREISVTK